MRVWKKVFALVLPIVLATGLLVGCSKPNQAGPEGKTSGTTSVIDVYGRTVEVPQNVEKVATVGSGARFVVYAGGQDKLIAVTEKETKATPSRPYTMVYKDTFAQLPATSNGNHLMETNVNNEQLLDLKPDVIISSRSGAECDELQHAIGIPVVGISYQDQMFSDDVYASISVVGKAIGTADHANNVVAALKGWQKDLDDRTKDIPDAEKPSCYVGAVNYKGAKSFGGTYCNYPPLDAVHAKNVADEVAQKDSVQVDLEQIGAWDPDYMFLNAGNMNLMQEDYASNKVFFDNLKAFRNGHLYSQPAFNYNGTNIELAVCDAYFIGFTLYPDRFADLDPATTYDTIFTTMLGQPYYDAMKASGMDFTTVSFAE